MKNIYSLAKHFIFVVVFNASFLYVLSNYFPTWGFQVLQTNYDVFITYGVLGLLFWFINAIVGKIFKMLTFPLKYITFGLSSLIINVILFYVFEYVLLDLDIGIQIQIGNIIHITILSVAIMILYYIIKKI